MTDATVDTGTVAGAAPKKGRRDIGLKGRYAAERRFQFYGLAAIALGLTFLFLLLSSIILEGRTAFQQTSINLDITFDEEVINPSGSRDTSSFEMLSLGSYETLAENALFEALNIPEDDAEARADASGLLSESARVQLRDMVFDDLDIIGTTQNVWLLAHGNVDSAIKGQFDLSIDEERRQVNDRQIAYYTQLIDDGVIQKRFNTGMFVNGASTRPEAAGLGVAIIGSAYMMLIVLCLALPIGVAASIYLEEFAPKNRLTDIIEVNINNLAAVPSIVYGILGLAFFLNFLGVFERGAAVVGGLVLTLMTLPTIIIATRSALKAVPPSIRDAALGVGASKMQTVFHHVLPLAAPGILTGTIIGLATALGETAPLLLIGMVAFVADYPSTPFDPSTALPVQIYIWSGQAERAFVERTSGAIIVLLGFLAVMNITAIILRRRFERRW